MDQAGSAHVGRSTSNPARQRGRTLVTFQRAPMAACLGCHVQGSTWVGTFPLRGHSIPPASVSSVPSPSIPAGSVSSLPVVLALAHSSILCHSPHLTSLTSPPLLLPLQPPSSILSIVAKPHLPLPPLVFLSPLSPLPVLPPPHSPTKSSFGASPSAFRLPSAQRPAAAFLRHQRSRPSNPAISRLANTTAGKKSTAPHHHLHFPPPPILIVVASPSVNF